MTWDTKIVNKTNMQATVGSQIVAPGSEKLFLYSPNGYIIKVEGAGIILVMEPDATYPQHVSTSWSVKLCSGAFCDYWGYEGHPTLTLILNPDLTFSVNPSIYNVPIQDGALDALKDSILAYYPLHGDIYDYSFNGINPESSQQLSYVDGIWGLAADFTKSSTVIKLPTFNRYLNDYTLSAWVNMQDSQNIYPRPLEYGDIVGKLSVRHSDGKLLFCFEVDSDDSRESTATDYHSKGSLSVNQWHHVCVTYRNNNRTLSFFIDGLLDCSYDVSNCFYPPCRRPFFSDTITIGGGMFRSSLKGYISDVSLYNDSIDCHAAALLAGKDERQHSLQAFPLFLIIPAFMTIVGIVASAFETEQLKKQNKNPEEPNYNTNTFLPAFNPMKPFDTIECLDVWGEGYIKDGTMVTGFRKCYNLNRNGQLVSNGPDIYRKIPNLIPVSDYKSGFNENLIKDNSVKHVTLMGSPIVSNFAQSIARVIDKRIGIVVIYGKDDSDPDRKAELDILLSELSKINFEEKRKYKLEGPYLEITLGDIHVYSSKSIEKPIIEDVC